MLMVTIGMVVARVMVKISQPRIDDSQCGDVDADGELPVPELGIV